jgi:hypothetical protein
MKRTQNLLQLPGKLLLLLLILPVAAACSPEGRGYSSMTVNLAKGDDKERAECAAGFEQGEQEEMAGSDGSIWIWVKGPDKMLSHYCRRRSNGEVEAWDEASRNTGATHSLKFDSNDSPAVFQPIEAK